MKQIWIWNHYASDMFASLGGRHYWFAKQLIKKGYLPSVFCASTFHKSDEIMDTGRKKSAVKFLDNIPFVFVKARKTNAHGFSRILNIVTFYLNIFSAAKRYAKENGKPDAILASSVHPLTLIAGIKTARKFHIPCICEIRDLWPEAIFSYDAAKEKSLLGKILIAGEHWIYRHADKLIFTKEGDADYIKEKRWDTGQGGDIDMSNVYYINNGVDIAAFSNNVKCHQLDDEDLLSAKTIVTYVGAIRPLNNIERLVETALLLKDHSDIKILIYGSGSELPALSEQASALGLTNIAFKGEVDKQYIPYILSKSYINLLVYTSTKWNWSRGNSSNKLFEYMASGKPIISNVKMNYSIIDRYKCGLELEEDTPAAIAEAILSIKNMPANEYEVLGENGKTGAMDFDFTVLTDKLIAVLDTVW
jgi:glycosyltransferase involved in cell wall biosynthesis